MSTLPDSNIFRFIGYRITKLEIDESSLGDAAEPLAAEITIAFATPIDGAEKNGRTVLEMSLQIDATVVQPEGTTPRPLAISARIVAGLSVDGEFDTAARQKLEQENTFYARSLYWLLRDRVMSAACYTKFRALPLPWDIWELGWPPNSELPSRKSPAKATPKKSAIKPLARKKK